MSLTDHEGEPLGLSLAVSLARIFDNRLDTDVKFLIGDEKAEVVAHKLILKSRSPVFRAMFDDSPISESNTVTIPDTDKATFETFLRYLYVDEIKELQSIDEINCMLYLVEKYMMPTMKPICVTFLQKLLDLDNVFQIFKICSLYSLHEFMEIVIKFMAERANECCNLDTFVQQDHLLIEKFTETPHLCIAETKLLDAVLRWATNECNRRNIASNSENIREVLGKVLRNIRFLSISEAELQRKLLFDGLLRVDEEKELTRLYNEDSAGLKSDMFDVSPRTGISYEKISRSQQVPHGYENEKKHALTMTTSDNVWLFGVSICGPCASSEHVCVVIQVMADGNHYSKEAHYLELKAFENKIADVMFQNPIRLRPNVQYTLLLTRFCSASEQGFHYINDMVKELDFHGTTLTFSDEVDTKYQSFSGRGQFPRFFLQGMNESYVSKIYKTARQQKS